MKKSYKNQQKDIIHNNIKSKNNNCIQKNIQQISTKSNEYWMYGHHSVIAAIKNPKRIIRTILLTYSGQENFLKLLSCNAQQNNNSFVNYKDNKNASSIHHILSHFNKYCEILYAKDINELCSMAMLTKDSVTQGICAIVKKIESEDLDSFLQSGANGIILDKVVDPHNIGAIVRTAAALGYQSVITPYDGSPGESCTIAKSAAGGLEKIQYIRAVNIARVIDTAKKNGYFIIGLDADTQTNLNEIPQYIKEMKKILVFGNEQNGIRRLIKEKCDFITKIPMKNNTESLNVSNAAAIAMYSLILL